MKCVGYDYEFEKHLARSLKEFKPPLSGSSKQPKLKPKSITQEVDNEYESEDDEKEDEPNFFEPRHSKRQRVAKEKAKHIRYDWP